ncbi:hypothetical protein BgiBS90_035889 [Biomphalaria glabrata]|nr:hypothetical protein BgiBS90_035889 [Biomphalaria glabrata]
MLGALGVPWSDGHYTFAVQHVSSILAQCGHLVESRHDDALSFLESTKPRDFGTFALGGQSCSATQRGDSPRELAEHLVWSLS